MVSISASSRNSISLKGMFQLALVAVFFTIFLCHSLFHHDTDAVLAVDSHSITPCPRSTVSDGLKRTTSHPSTTFRDDSCLSAAYLYLCLLNKQEEKVQSQSQCYANPANYFKENFSAYTPKEKEVEAREILQSEGVRNLSVGCGPNSAGLCSQVVKDKTLCTDRPQLDLFETNSWLNLLSVAEDGLEVIFASHVLEHFEPVQISKIAAAAFLALKPGGVFRVAVPDGYKPSPSYQQYIRVGGTPSGAGQSHMVAWTTDNMPPLFESVGFDILPREHFDVRGKFFTAPDAYEKDAENGLVSRSFKYDPRNKKPYKQFDNAIGNILVSDLREDEPMFTSLWFDAVKPETCKDVWSNIV